MRKTIGERLLELKWRSGLPLSEIARLAGYKGPSSLQRYFSAEYDPASLDYRLAQKLGDALREAGQPPIQPFELLALTAAGADVMPAKDGAARQSSLDTKVFIPAFQSHPVPVEITVAGTSLQEHMTVPGLAIERAEPIKEFEVSPFLQRREVWAFLNSGDRMSPRYDDGELVFTEGRLRPVMGGYALAIVAKNFEHDVHWAILGRMVHLSESMVVLEQLSSRNDPSEQLRIDMADVFALRRVMRPEDLLE